MKKLYSVAMALMVFLVSNASPDEFAIFFVRGLNSNEAPTAILNAFSQEFPTIPVVIAKIGDGSAKATQNGMYHQVGQVCDDALKNPLLKDKRVIVIGSSQGGVVARAFIEMYKDKVPFAIEGFLSCASPQGGQFGLPDGWESYVDLVVMHGDKILLQQIAHILGIKNLMIEDKEEIAVERAMECFDDETLPRDILDPIRKAIAKLVKQFVKKDFGLVRIIFYNPLGQDLISVAGYWRDPENRLDYLAFNRFLPFINNEREHVDADRYKANLSSLKRIVFLWASKDNVVKPDCSGSFRFYKWGSRTDVQADFTETMQYTDDLLGLGTMYNDGRLFIENPYGMGHGCEGPGVEIAMHHLREMINS